MTRPLTISRTLFFILTTITLTACSSLSTTQLDTSRQLQQAEKAFDAAEYEQSLQSLLPIAQQGNPKAQYAIGYMYYYGKGVERNLTLAKNWIRNAAEQGYTPARDALNMLNNYEATAVPTVSNAHPPEPSLDHSVESQK